MLSLWLPLEMGQVGDLLPSWGSLFVSVCPMLFPGPSVELCSPLLLLHRCERTHSLGRILAALALFLCSSLRLGSGFFRGQNPPAESSQAAPELWQVLLGLAGTRHCLLPSYQGPADAKPLSGLLFAKA